MPTVADDAIALTRPRHSLLGWALGCRKQTMVTDHSCLQRTRFQHQQHRRTKISCQSRGLRKLTLATDWLACGWHQKPVRPVFLDSTSTELTLGGAGTGSQPVTSASSCQHHHPHRRHHHHRHPHHLRCRHNHPHRPRHHLCSTLQCGSLCTMERCLSM